MDKVHPNGNITYTAAAAIAKGNPVKFSSGKVTPCTAANDQAIGIALDSAAQGDIVPVAILGCFTGTVQLKAGGDDPVETQLAQTAAFVRGIIASSPQTVRADSRAIAIPPSLVQPAMDHLRFRLLTRLDISVNESRRLAYERACEIFDEIRAGRLSVEPGTDEDAGSEVARSPLASNKHPPRFLD